MAKKKKKKVSEEQIRQKAWRIFLIRKIVEISIVLFIICVPYILGNIILGKESALCGEGKLFDEYSGKWSPKSDICDKDYFVKWGTGTFCLILTAFVIFLIVIWIKYNWDESVYEAKSKLGYYD